MVQQQETAQELRARRRVERYKRRKRAAQRQGLFYVFCIAALGGLYWYAQGDLTPSNSYAQQARVVLDEAQRTMLRETSKSFVESLDARDRRRLEQQRGVVGTAASRHVGSPLRGGDLGDLRILQELVDQRVFAVDQVYELQALGVVLGDVMAEQFGLSWVVVDDRYGRTRALQYGDLDDVFFPVTMISRRYEKNIPVDVDELYRKMEAEVAKLSRRRGSSPVFR